MVTLGEKVRESGSRSAREREAGPAGQRLLGGLGRRVGSRGSQAISFVVAAIVLGYLLLPFFWMLKSAFQPPVEIAAAPPIWIPENPVLGNFEGAFNMLPFGRLMLNSLWVAVMATLVTVVCASMSAYITARFGVRGVAVILAVLLFTQLVPGITRLFPVYFLLEDLNLLNTYTGMIATYVGFSIPFAALILHGYFQGSCPPALEESAYVDGCSNFQAFRRIFVPVSMPGITAIACVVFLQIWNDFLWASAILFRGDKTLLQVGLRAFFGEQGSIQFMGVFMAACVLTTVPALFLFRFIQRYMVTGMGSGALKG